MSDQGPGFAVDPAGVRTFGAALRRDLDEHLSPENDRIVATFLDTPLFGSAAVSGVVRQAAKDYAHQLINLLDVVDVLLYNGAVLAETAQRVADAYATSDIASADQLLALTGSARAEVAADRMAERAADDPWKAKR